jgi:hypothetical protein
VPTNLAFEESTAIVGGVNMTTAPLDRLAPRDHRDGLRTPDRSHPAGAHRLALQGITLRAD